MFQTCDCFSSVTSSDVFLKWLFVMLPRLTRLSRQLWKNVFCPSRSTWIPCKQLACWLDRLNRSRGLGPVASTLKLNIQYQHPVFEADDRDRGEKAEGSF